MPRKPIDISGKKFNKLTAIEFNHIKEKKHFWLFKCDCGKLIIAEKLNVLYGSKKSCGCINNKIDITGQKFNRLTAIKFSHMDKHWFQHWLFRCDCGTEKIIGMQNVMHGKTISCGCYNKEKSTTHGYTNHPLFNIWKKMIQRCHDKNDRTYKSYGARGISVCDEWKNSFDSFAKDMGTRPSKKHSIDRIDNNLGYRKDNCRWTTGHEQSINRRNVIYVEYNGERKRLFDLCEEMGVDRVRTFKRINYYGWTTEKAITEPPRKIKSRRNHHN